MATTRKTRVGPKSKVSNKERSCGEMDFAIILTPFGYEDKAYYSKDGCGWELSPSPTGCNDILSMGFRPRSTYSTIFDVNDLC